MKNGSFIDFCGAGRRTLRGAPRGSTHSVWVEEPKGKMRVAANGEAARMNRLLVSDGAAGRDSGQDSSRSRPYHRAPPSACRLDQNTCAECRAIALHAFEAKGNPVIRVPRIGEQGVIAGLRCSRRPRRGALLAACDRQMSLHHYCEKAHRVPGNGKTQRFLKRDSKDGRRATTGR